MHNYLYYLVLPYLVFTHIFHHSTLYLPTYVCVYQAHIHVHVDTQECSNSSDFIGYTYIINEMYFYYKLKL